MNLSPAGVVADLLDEAEQLLDLGLRTVQLDDENGFRGGEAGVAGGFRRFDGEPIHHLDRRRDDACRADFRDGAPSGSGRVERGEQRSHCFGRAKDSA